jgi:membrane protease YdiL (CAAX protease family)
MKFHAGMLFVIMLSPVLCIAAVKNNETVAPDVTMPAPSPSQSPIELGIKLNPEDYRLPSPRFEDTPSGTPAVVKFTPAEKPSRRSIFATDRVSKIVCIIALLFQLMMFIAAAIIFFRIRKLKDPMLHFARNTAFLIVILKIAVAFLRETNLQTSHVIFILVDYGVMFPFLIAVIYTGHHLWRKFGVDYWGIAMWKTDRKKLIGISLVVLAVSLGYSRSLFALTHSLPGWASLRTPPDASEARRIAIILLAAAGAAFLEEFLFRGCFQAMFHKWFGQSPRASIFAILATSTFWALVHTGSVSPDWIKYLQIFPQGLILGWWYQRAGLAGTIPVHMSFNLVVSFFPYHHS